MTAPERHAFLLLPRFSLLSLAGAVDALTAADELLGRQAYRCTLLSADGLPVLAGGGTRVAVDAAPALAQRFDAVHVVSDMPLPDPARELLHPWLRTQALAGAVLGGISTGAAVLAQAGLLDGQRATVVDSLVAPLSAAHAGVVFSSRVYELAPRRLSCAGGTASLEMMIAWLGSRHGERLVQQLLLHFGLERLRGPDERQRAPTAARLGASSARLAEAVALMEANLGEPLPTEDIARLVGVSRRQLERLFKQHLDELPSRYYAELRLLRAQRLLQQTPQSILQVALACGFASGSHFSNAYRARFGRTPRDERSQRAAAWRDLAAPTVATPGDTE